MTDTRLSQQPATAGTPLWPAVIELPRQAVVIFHDDGRLPRRSPVTALVEDGDRVGTGLTTLPPAFHGRGHGIQWGHDAEALVLSQQPDAALPLAATACTDVLEVAWNPTAGRRRRAERGALPIGSPLWRRAGLAAARRYLAGPGTTRQRDGEVGAAVRATAADVLQALHDERDPVTGLNRYDRVVVIGAGLGSVVAYAAVHDCWGRRHPQPGAGAEPGVETGDGPPGPARDLERVRRRLAVAAARMRAEGGTDAPDAVQGDVAALRAEYRRRQAGLAGLLRDHADARRWLVTDLVTMGSPLAHDDVLVSRASQVSRQSRDTCERVGAGELSTCPPPDGWELPGAAAAFAPVRWTNLWFAGDGMAGPVAGHLGAGVEDVDLGGARGLPALGVSDRHSRYWAPPAGPDDDTDAGLSAALLHRLVRRRPTLLLAADGPVDTDELVERLRVAARYPTARGAVVVEVRLGTVRADGAVATRYLPIGPVPLPADLALRDVRAALGPRGGSVLLLSDGAG